MVLIGVTALQMFLCPYVGLFVAWIGVTALQMFLCHYFCVCGTIWHCFRRWHSQAAAPSSFAFVCGPDRCGSFAYVQSWLCRTVCSFDRCDSLADVQSSLCRTVCSFDRCDSQPSLCGLVPAVPIGAEALQLASVPLSLVCVCGTIWHCFLPSNRFPRSLGFSGVRWNTDV